MDQFDRRSMGLGDAHAVNASLVLRMDQQRDVQIVASVFSSLSLASALLAIYWFCLMRRNFRRDLVLLLIVGGCWKSLWFLIFSGVTFARGPIKTTSVFCQGSGYMLQVGFESCDFAILFMSMHMVLQIFPPSHSIFGHDGLYRVRRWVYAAWVIFPNLSAALAFINPSSAYLAQGGFCTLPLRPFWYRLALFWIPRYLIWLYIVYVAAKIYLHVGSQFKVFGQERDRSSSMNMPDDSSVDEDAQMEQEEKIGGGKVHFKHGNFGDAECAPDDISGACMMKPTKASPLESDTSSPFAAVGQRSDPTWKKTTDEFVGDSNVSTQITKSTPSSRRGSRQIALGVFSEDFAPPPASDFPRHRGSITSIASKRSSAAPSFEAPLSLPPIQEGQGVLPPRPSTQEPSANTAMKRRRRAIVRQLRLLFIYPCIYMMLWVIPFVVHCMNYSNYWAQHPVFPLSILQVFCMAVMTFCDVFIFCWRERPWRHIPGSDGTFLGSLMWWRICFEVAWLQRRRESRVPSFVPDESAAETEKSVSRLGLLSSVRNWSISRKGSSPRGSQASSVPASARPTMAHKRAFSASSDRRYLEAERAQERLALERAEYENNRRSLEERRQSVLAQLHTPGQKRKEWFDQHMDSELFTDHEHELNDLDDKRGEV